MFRTVSDDNWYIYWNHDRTCIDVTRTPKGRYLNHVCLPNTVTVPRHEASLYLVALRDIAEGEELTMDYDYPEIFKIFGSHNPGCLHAACPRAAAQIQGDRS